jgi:hypothetical protein
MAPNAQTRQGFALQEDELAELLRAAKDLVENQVYVDPSYPYGLDLSARIIRVLQLGLEAQFNENDQLVNDYNALREEMQVCDRWSQLVVPLLHSLVP